MKNRELSSAFRPLKRQHHHDNAMKTERMGDSRARYHEKFGHVGSAEGSDGGSQLPRRKVG